MLSWTDDFNRVDGPRESSLTTLSNSAFSSGGNLRNNASGTGWDWSEVWGGAVTDNVVHNDTQHETEVLTGISLPRYPGQTSNYLYRIRSRTNPRQTSKLVKGYVTFRSGNDSAWGSPGAWSGNDDFWLTEGHRVIVKAWYWLPGSTSLDNWFTFDMEPGRIGTQQADNAGLRLKVFDNTMRLNRKFSSELAGTGTQIPTDEWFQLIMDVRLSKGSSGACKVTYRTEPGGAETTLLDLQGIATLNPSYPFVDTLQIGNTAWNGTASADDSVNRFPWDMFVGRVNVDVFSTY